MSEITASRDNRRTRPKGYADWSPRAKTRTILGQVNEILAEYEDYLPLTVRQIFYRLVAAYMYEKTDKAYDRLADYIVRARRAEILPFAYIRDDGVVQANIDWFDSPEDFWNDAGLRAKEYRRDRQEGQDHRLELWCEAAGMLPQLARVANEFSVPVFSSGGFSSLSAVRHIVDRAVRRDHSTVLLHVGDFDPSGVSVFESVAADVVAFFERDRILASQEIIPIRVALTADQVAEYDLPTAPAKSTDRRSSSWSGGTCQLEALAPDQLAEIVKTAILEWFDEDELADQVEQEDQDRDELLRALPRAT